MKVESAVSCLSWIPSEAITGVNKLVFGSGFTHYDPPPPDTLGDLEELREADRFRFTNHLVGWIEVADGSIVGAGYGGGCLMGSTTIAVGSLQATFAAVAFPDLRQPVEISDDATSARFVQTVGGHTAVPAPRRLNRPPFVAFAAPTVWSTLSLTIHSDGNCEFDLIGASRFPRHWVYDAEGRLAAKAGVADFKEWLRHSFGAHTPWGDEDSDVFVTQVETALERELAGRIMRGGTAPSFRKLKAGGLLTEQGTDGDELFLLLNGVLVVEVDGEPLAEVGPGAILGERAALEGGRRTSTLRAVTPAKVAVLHADLVDRDILATISEGHRREQRGS